MMLVLFAVVCWLVCDGVVAVVDIVGVDTVNG
jgi:hypothetical protein